MFHIKKKQLRKILRYTILFLVVVLSMNIIPKNLPLHSEILIVATIVMTTFVLLDIYHPILC